LTSLTLLTLLTFLAGPDTGSPNVWLCPPGGKLERAGRDGDSIQKYDALRGSGTCVFRGRQIAFQDGAGLPCVVGSGGVVRTDASAPHVVGWREAEPLIWDGTMIKTLAGINLAAQPRTGDTPVFADFFGDAGTLVTRTASGSIRFGVTGSPPLFADFGEWTLVAARMVNATSGLFVLQGMGWAVVRVAHGRAEIVASQREDRLDVLLASDGRAYIVHHTETETDLPRPATDLAELNQTGAPEPFCRLRGDVDVIDVDRALKVAYLVAKSGKSSLYSKVSYGSFDDPVALKEVAWVLPAWGGGGFDATRP